MVDECGWLTLINGARNWMGGTLRSWLTPSDLTKCSKFRSERPPLYRYHRELVGFQVISQLELKFLMFPHFEVQVASWYRLVQVGRGSTNRESPGTTWSQRHCGGTPGGRHDSRPFRFGGPAMSGFEFLKPQGFRRGSAGVVMTYNHYHGRIHLEPGGQIGGLEDWQVAARQGATTSYNSALKLLVGMHRVQQTQHVKSLSLGLKVLHAVSSYLNRVLEIPWFGMRYGEPRRKKEFRYTKSANPQIDQIQAPESVDWLTDRACKIDIIFL